METEITSVYERYRNGHGNKYLGLRGIKKVLQVLGTDTETRILGLTYCLRGSVSGRLSYTGDTPVESGNTLTQTGTGNRRYPVNRETYCLGLVLENRRHPVDRETPRTELVLENRRHPVDQETPRTGLVSGAGDTRRESRNTSIGTGIRKPETPGGSRETPRLGQATKTGDTRAEKHLGPGEI